MKTTTSLLNRLGLTALAAVFTLSFTACGDDDDDNGGGGGGDNPTPTATLTTLNHTDVTMGGATLKAEWKPAGKWANAYGFIYTDQKVSELTYANCLDYVGTTHTPPGTYGEGTYTVKLQMLVPGKTYYYRAIVSMGDNVYIYGETRQFTTPTPTIKTGQVDLGLSVYWAANNLGATAPQYAGDYYAWGETSLKATYTWENYKFGNGGEKKLTKYNPKSTYGTVDSKTQLDLTDDAARVKLGSLWRIPTKAEAEELVNNCTWTCVTWNNVRGYMVTGKNGNSIFLPITGYRASAQTYQGDTGGYYWTSTVYSNEPDCAYYLIVWPEKKYESDPFLGFGTQRRCGLNIRPVMPKS